MGDVLPTLIIFHCNGIEEKKFIEYTVRTGTSPFLILFKNIYEKNLVQTLNNFTNKCSALILFSKALLDLTWRIESKEIIEEELPKITKKNVNILLDVSKQDVQRKNINVLGSGFTIDARKLFMKREPNENPRFWKKIEISLRSGDVEKDAHFHNVLEDVATDMRSVDNCLVTATICKGYNSVSIERLEENKLVQILDKHGNKQLLDCFYACSDDKCESIDLMEKIRSPDVAHISFNYGTITKLDEQINDTAFEVQKFYNNLEVADFTVEYPDDAQVIDEIDEFEKESFNSIGDSAFDEDLLDGSAVKEDVKLEENYDKDNIRKNMKTQHELYTSVDDVILHNHDANLHGFIEINDNIEIRSSVKSENVSDERNNEVTGLEKNEILDENFNVRRKIYLKSGCDINVHIVTKKSHDFVVDTENAVVKPRDVTSKTRDPVNTSRHLYRSTNRIKEDTTNDEIINVVQLKSIEHNCVKLKCCYEESTLYLNVDHTLQFYEVLEIDVGSEMTNIVERHRISDAIPLGEPLFEDDEENTPVMEKKTEETKPTSNNAPYGGLLYHKTVFAF